MGLARRITVDRERCIGTGNCALLAPGVFALDADAKSTVVDRESANDAAIEQAIASCPTSAITVQRAADVPSQGHGAGSIGRQPATRHDSQDSLRAVGSSCAELGRHFDHHDPALIKDPFPVFNTLRRHCPAVHSPNYGGYWLLTRYEDVLEGARDWHRLTSSVPNNTAIPSTHPRDYPDLPIEIDPPEHSRYRQLIAPVFARTRVQALRPALTRIAHELVDEIVSRGGADVATGFAVPMSVGTLAQFMGLPDEERMMWAATVDRMMNVQDISTQERADATRTYVEYVDSLIRQRRDSPGLDFISMLLKSRVDGQQLSHDEIRSFSVVLLIAGHETTAAAMGMTLHYLATHPDARRRLYASPQMFDTAIEEFLRWSSPIVLLGRNAVGELSIHGQSIPDGDVVALVWASANRDEAQFDNPDECILDRSPNRHLAFGWGPHMCAGAHVARLEMRVMLEVFSQRLPEMRLDPSRPVVHKPHGHIRGFEHIPVLVS